MIRPWHSLCMLLIASVSLADFVGFPLATSTNAGNWYQARDLYNPIGQLYSGVVERCEWTGVALPDIVETWTVSAGSSNSVSGGYTNIILLTTTVTTTNQIGPFSYEYTDPSGTHTSTAIPYLTRSFVNALDTKIDALIPYFVDFSVASNDLYDAYFYTMSTNHANSRKVWDDFLDASKAGIFDRNGLGYIVPETVTTNAGGYVTGGTAYYTRQPEVQRIWLLSELHNATSGWAHVDVGAFDTRMYDTNILPVVTYLQGGTNPLTTISMTITGLVLNVSNQTTYGTSEVVSVSSTTTACTLPWYDISNLTTVSTAPNTGDVLSVAYTNEIVLYGDSSYRLYAEDLDERYYVLKNLVATEHADHVWYLSDGASNSWSGFNAHGVTDTVAIAKAACVADYSADYSTAFPRKEAWLEYEDAAAPHTGSEDWSAKLWSAQDKVEVRNIPTNLRVNVDLYFPVLASEYDRSPSDTNDQWFYDDYSRNYKTNQTQRLQTQLLSIGATNFVSWFFGDTIIPVWPLTDPPKIDGALHSRGFKFDGKGVLLRPQFQFK